jgi:hypothetical protein
MKQVDGGTKARPRRTMSVLQMKAAQPTPHVGPYQFLPPLDREEFGVLREGSEAGGQRPRPRKGERQCEGTFQDPCRKRT